ncbi:MAG: Fe-S protein assembly co-chaperone HscB [Ferruginibacter sp.]
MNYFELFDLPVSLQADRSSLAKKYFELQKKHHPDFYTNADEDEQKDALEISSTINKALKVLQQPDQTIKYVLQLKGLLEEEEKYQLPPDFLMEMMEMNEKLLEEDPDDFRKEVAELENTLYEEIKDIVENYDDNTVSTESLLKVKDYYFKKKYLHRILDRLGD